jgi:4-cresol dehydrogenase (hydroxylating)
MTTFADDMRNQPEPHMIPTGATRTVIELWRQCLAPARVLDDDASLDRYARSTQDRGTRPSCVLFPVSTQEVQAIARIASAHGAVLYPISCGKNWGYGDACATTGGAAIVDLGRMNRIIEVNETLAYTVIEPGVTQGQLYAHLRAIGSKLWIDCTGAGPDASLVGNTLDRGFGHTRYSDHVRTTCGMEIVLADGRVLQTGFKHYPNAQAAHVFPYGVGPSLDGIFCQSNLGIITRITLWLQPEPEVFAFFYLRIDRDDQLGPLIEALRPLRLRGDLDTAVHIANDLRLLSANGNYPWQAAGGKTPLPAALRESMRTKLTAGAWTAGGSLVGSRERVAGAKRALKQAAALVGARVNFVGDGLIGLAEQAQRVLSLFGGGKQLREQLRTLKPNYGLLKGIPTSEPLRGTQWRLRTLDETTPLDPLDAGVGLMWLSPTLPMTGDAADELLSIIAPIYAKHAFEPLVTLTLVNERAIVAILNVCFDKREEAEAQAAMACYDELSQRLRDAGYFPYRTGPRGMPPLRSEGDSFWDVAAQIKSALDPDDIIARGRYLAPLNSEENGE